MHASDKTLFNWKQLDKKPADREENKMINLSSFFPIM